MNCIANLQFAIVMILGVEVSPGHAKQASYAKYQRRKLKTLAESWQGIQN